MFMPSRNLLHIFREEFRYFACMDSFKEEYALYLIDSNLLGAMAKSLIDKESGFSVQVKPLLGTNLKTYNYNNSLTKNNLPF